MTSSVQGHAYLFRVYDTSSRIKCEILHDRSLTSKDLLNDNHPISFIDNVNLHKLPPNCFGSLIAISQNPFSKSSNEKSATLFKWEIAVLIHLDIRKTIICPCSFPDGDIQIHFQKMKEYHFFQCPFQIRYLNRITESSNASDDGFIESLVRITGYIAGELNVPFFTGSVPDISKPRKVKLTAVKRFLDFIPGACKCGPNS